MIKYSEEQIKEAVDIAIGYDGFRGKEVIEILRVLTKERFENNKRRKSNGSIWSKRLCNR